MIIAVGSKNPTKIESTKLVFSYYFKEIKVVGVDVDSGVKDQPNSDDEMYKGAFERAKKSLNKVSNSDYGVGIEGGIHKYSYGWFE
ncbi:DUF84 family protein, partial [Patescibacteria group bacterium]